MPLRQRAGCLHRRLPPPRLPRGVGCWWGWGAPVRGGGACGEGALVGRGCPWGGGECGQGTRVGRGLRLPSRQGAVKVREPGGCCPVCREEWPGKVPAPHGGTGRPPASCGVAPRAAGGGGRCRGVAGATGSTAVVPLPLRGAALHVPAIHRTAHHRQGALRPARRRGQLLRRALPLPHHRHRRGQPAPGETGAGWWWGVSPFFPPPQPCVFRAGAVPAEPLRVLQLPPGPRQPHPHPAPALSRRPHRARGAARHPQLPVQQLPG